MMSPYRPQSLPSGTRLRAVLEAPLSMGAAIVGKASLNFIGSMPPDDSIVSARLITSLASRTSKPGDPLKAVLTLPLFSRDHRLIFPVGSLLRGKVLSARAARSLHRNGELHFEFTSIEPPDLGISETSSERNVDGTLAGVHIGTDMSGLRVDASGDTRIAESKMRFFAPAYATLKAGFALNATADPVGRAFASAYTDNFMSAVVGNGPGFGILGGVSAAMIPPVAIGFAFYGAAGSI